LQGGSNIPCHKGLSTFYCGETSKDETESGLTHDVSRRSPRAGVSLQNLQPLSGDETIGAERVMGGPAYKMERTLEVLGAPVVGDSGLGQQPKENRKKKKKKPVFLIGKRPV